MQTSHDLGVDLDLVTDEGQAEDCWCCHPKIVEATGYVEYSDVCPCGFPNPAPLCEKHYNRVNDYLESYGPDFWDCPVCGHSTSVVGAYRKSR